MRRAGRSARWDRWQRNRGIPALDGLRAVAVALVLVGHGGIPGVGGGFIGVDIFFVLSGFLITSLLLDELGRTGRIELTGFWIRRARRLLPALVLMVLAVGAARELLPAQALSGLRNDALAAFLWMANWRFVAQRTDYFTQGAPPSPLQHTWSLGVEEQYYIVWPVLLIAVTLVLATRARRYFAKTTVGDVRFAVFVLASLGALASAAVAIVLVSNTTRDRVYFGTDTRVQALLVGAAASALLVRDWPALNHGWCLVRTRWGRRIARLLPVVGLAGLAALVHYATGSAGEFRHGLLIGVAIAAVIVVAPVAVDQDGAVARILALRPLVWLGTISYGVYLWHWPIFLALNGERTGWSGLPLFAARCAVTTVVAAASWWLIEQPIRRWRPSGVPLLPLAAATVASAAAATLMVVPVGTGPSARARPATWSLGGCGDLAVAAGRKPPKAGATRSQPAVHRFGVRRFDRLDLMHFLPPTPGFAFLDHTVIGCSLVRGTPYRYIGQTLEQRAECDNWPIRWSTQVGLDQPDVALLIIGRWETVDRVNEGRWTHIGDPTFDAYLNGELSGP